MVGEPGGVFEEPVDQTETADESVATVPIALTITEGLDAEERIFLQKLNEYRAANNLAPLQVSVALTKACEYHSNDMATKNYFSHDSQDGTTWSARIKKYYNYNTYYAENIAAGNAGGDATFTQWKNSPGHDANMRSANYRVIGISRVYSATSTYKWYWTTDFGGYVDEVMTTDGTTPPPPPPPTTTNLITNGTFETADLTSGVDYTAVRTTGKWYAGSQAGTATIASGLLRVVDALTGYIGVAQLVAATPGKSYTFSTKVRYVSGRTNGQIVYIDFLDAAYARIGRTTLSAGSSATQHTITRAVTAPAGTAFARITLYGYQSNNDYASTFEWDDVSLVAN
jgi:uncharacterized protein YkwD